MTKRKKNLFDSASAAKLSKSRTGARSVPYNNITSQSIFARRSERDEETVVVQALQDRNFTVRQDVPAGDGYADVYGERDDVQIVIEMKRRDKFHTRGLRKLAQAQAKRYASVLKPLYVGMSDGQTLHVLFQGKTCVHQLVGGMLLDVVASGPCPLDVGADYHVFQHFPRRQRDEYRTTDPSIIPRNTIFDLDVFVNDTELDAAMIAGEPGAGKTTYGWQLADSKRWDPLWLDGSLLANNPLQTLDEARDRLTGYTGNLASFLATMVAYRSRNGEPPIGIVVDGLDEWTDAASILPALLRFAKSVGIKVLILGRARTIDALMGASTLKPFRIRRYDLSAFDEKEQARAELRYIATHGLLSGFTGRAKEMSALPEMMALIAEAYKGEAVDPEVTEEDVYRRYRRKKCAAMARSGTTSEAAQEAIDAIARCMLQHDNVNLPYSIARQATFLVDHLLREGVVRSDGDERNRHLRFRFGRVRDDALQSLTIDALFDKPIVGRSALTYSALRDVSKRREFIRRSLLESDVEAVCLVREHGWWTDLAKVPPSLVKRPFVLLAYAREKLRAFPELLVLGGADSDALRLASVHGVDTPIAVWRGWLGVATDEQQLHDICRVSTAMLKAGKLPLTEAIEAAQLIRSRLFQDSRDANEGPDFWHLIDEICKRLSPREARRFLYIILPRRAIARSSASQMSMFYHGISYPHDMINAVEGVRARSKPQVFEAWASTLLLAAMCEEWPGFEGREWSGGDRDNAWLVDAILPSMHAILRSDETRAARLLRGYRISRLHPAFRLRAYIAAAPIAALESIPERMLEWRNCRSSGIPALYEALDARAIESTMIQQHGLNDALNRFEQPLNHAQAKTFHRRLASRDPVATRQAFAFVSRSDFPRRDMFQVDFFDHLDWAPKRPVVAAKMLAAALDSGYDHFSLMRSRGYSDVMTLALTNRQVRKTLSAVSGIADAMADMLHSVAPEVRAAQAIPLYDSVSQRGRRSIMRWAHELPIEIALEIMRRGIRDEALVPDACSSDDDIRDGGVSFGSFHSDVWCALVMCSQKWPETFFHALGVDILRHARMWTSPVSVAATLHPVKRYGAEFRDGRELWNQLIEYYLLVGHSSGPNLRELAAEQAALFYGVMTDQQRDRFFTVFRDTKEVATASVHVARLNIDSAAAVQRALDQASSNRRRSAIAWLLWQEMHAEWHDLTPFDASLVETLLTHSDENTLQHLSHLAISMSQGHAAKATSLLLRVSDRSLASKATIHAIYDMRYDWSQVSVSDLTDAVALICAEETVGTANIEVAVSGLCAKTNPLDAQAVAAAFQSLIERFDYVREDFARWRASISRN
jgi:hypothetical protein